MTKNKYWFNFLTFGAKLQHLNDQNKKKLLLISSATSVNMNHVFIEEILNIGFKENKNLPGYSCIYDAKIWNALKTSFSAYRIKVDDLEVFLAKNTLADQKKQKPIQNSVNTGLHLTSTNEALSKAINSAFNIEDIMSGINNAAYGIINLNKLSAYAACWMDNGQPCIAYPYGNEYKVYQLSVYDEASKTWEEKTLLCSEPIRKYPGESDILSLDKYNVPLNKLTDLNSKKM